MPIVLLYFARNLKITRFTIDVLTQRLEQLESPRDGTSEECARFVGLTHESVAACDQLHDALRAKFSGVQSHDSRINSTLELVRIRDREIEEQHTAGEALTNARYNTSHLFFATRGSAHVDRQP